jgi:hypothetical protein
MRRHHGDRTGTEQPRRAIAGVGPKLLNQMPSGRIRRAPGSARMLKGNALARPLRRQRGKRLGHDVEWPAFSDAPCPWLGIQRGSANPANPGQRSGSTRVTVILRMYPNALGVAKTRNIHPRSVTRLHRNARVA